MVAQGPLIFKGIDSFGAAHPSPSAVPATYSGTEPARLIKLGRFRIISPCHKVMDGPQS